MGALLVLNWFFHRVYWTEHISRFHKRRKRLMNLTAGGLMSAQVFGFVLLGFSTVYREAFETVLFLQALELSSGLWVVLEGVALGHGSPSSRSTFVLERELPYKKMLIVTGVLLTVVLVIMVGKTARTMRGRRLAPDHADRHRRALLDGPLARHLPEGRDDRRPDRCVRLRDRQLRAGGAHARTGRRATAPVPAPAGASATGTPHGAAPASQPAAEREP